MPDKSVDAVVTDPPYGIGFISNQRAERYDAIIGDTSYELLNWACALSPNHSSYIFMRWDCVPYVPKPKSLIYWIKNNWSMGDLNGAHALQTEEIAFYPGDDHSFPNGRPANIIYANRSGSNNHPTEKPVVLMKKIIGWTCGTVFDPFAGSGTTGVACVELGRKFIGCEIDERYFDIACKRIDMAERQGKLF